MIINAGLSFLLEIAMLAIYFWAPFAYLSTLSVIIKASLSIALAAIAIFIWARYAAPKSVTRLSGWRLVALKLLVFIPAALLLGFKFSVSILLIGIVVAVLNVTLEYLVSSRPAR